jgi:hypothetical protein
MSTTNPDHGRPPADPVGGLAPIPPGTPRADDHDVSGPPAAETIARGHEVDEYDTTSVFSVPLLVVLFFVLAFGTVSVIFYFIFPNPADPRANPLAVEDSQKEIPDRLDDTPDPQLDNFRHLQGHSRSITSLERPTGSSPWIHPENLRVNPTNTPTLYRSGWLDPAKTRARLTIDEAMDVATRRDNVLKVAALLGPIAQEAFDAVTRKYFVLKAAAKAPAPVSSQNVPTAANAGRGEGPSLAIPPRDPLTAPEEKKAGGRRKGKK